MVILTHLTAKSDPLSPPGVFTFFGSGIPDKPLFATIAEKGDNPRYRYDEGGGYCTWFFFLGVAPSKWNEITENEMNMTSFSELYCSHILNWEQSWMSQTFILQHIHFCLMLLLAISSYPEGNTTTHRISPSKLQIKITSTEYTTSQTKVPHSFFLPLS